MLVKREFGSVHDFSRLVNLSNGFPKVLHLTLIQSRMKNYIRKIQTRKMWQPYLHNYTLAEYYLWNKYLSLMYNVHEGIIILCKKVLVPYSIISIYLHNHLCIAPCIAWIVAHARDPSGVIHAVRNWRIRLVEMSATHPPQHVVNKLLSEVVSRTQPLNTDPSTLTPESQMKGKNMKDNQADLNVMGSGKCFGKCWHLHLRKIYEPLIYLSPFYLFFIKINNIRPFC